MIDEISDLDDPRVADYRDVRERDLVGRAGRFIAEGEVVVRVLRRSRFAGRVRSYFLSRARRALAEELAASGAPVYVADETLMSSVVGFDIHRGVLACAEVGPPIDADALIAGARRLVVLESITNHDNVGGIFRNAAAFGVDGVLCDPATCDPLYRKSIRVSVGGALVVPFARVPSVAELLPRLAAAGAQTIALTPAHDALPIDRVPPSERRALVLGTEGRGLATETMAAATVRATIPMAAGFDSLNVATTSGIALYLLAR
jgi:tRNA G18 (ribose-2'-O)-methylase SpoU